MCIIAYKKEGVKPLDEETARECWFNNPHGAGYAYWNEKLCKWSVRKGYLNFKAFWDAYSAEKFTKDDIVVVHFRVATSGYKDGGNCHPFPMSNKLEELRNTSFDTDKIIFHNGKVGEGETVASDTVAHVRDLLEPLSRYLEFDPDLEAVWDHMLMLDKCRWVYCTPEEVTQYGKGWVTDDGGMEFSNRSYLPRSKPNVTVYSTGYSTYTSYNYGNETKDRDEAKKSKGSYVDITGDIISFKNACFDHREEKAIFDPNTGMIEWKNEDRDLIANLACPNCYDDTQIQSGGQAGHPYADSVCQTCGAVFDDHTGFIHMYDSSIQPDAPNNANKEVDGYSD